MDERKSPEREGPPSKRRVPALELPQRDREAVVALLSEAFSQDLLTTEEFEWRVEEAYRVETAEALVALTRDLPAPETGTEVAPAQPPGSDVPMLASAVLSNVERPGPQVLPNRFKVRAIVGNVELDLRRAEFPPGVTEITVNA